MQSSSGAYCTTDGQNNDSPRIPGSTRGATLGRDVGAHVNLPVTLPAAILQSLRDNVISLLNTAVSDYACPTCHAPAGLRCQLLRPPGKPDMCLARLHAASGDRYVINACAVAMLTYDSMAVADWQLDIREKGY